MGATDMVEGRIVSKTRVLVVEDERDIADLIKHTLERGGSMALTSSRAAIRRCVR